MSPAPPYDACVPVLLRYLDGLARVVAAVEALPDAPRLLQARLAPDMLPLARQVETAAHFALRTACPLAGEPVPPFQAAEPTCAALRQAIARTAARLRAITPAQFAADAPRTVREQAGEAALELPAARFLHEFALPNFFFHLNMAYAIARAQGAAIGKADYDGFHVYP